MTNKVKIAIDTMGGENSPKKIIDGIEISLKKNQENFFYLYGKKDLIEKEINTNSLVKKNSEIIHTEDVILDDESPLTGAKKSKKLIRHKGKFKLAAKRVVKDGGHKSEVALAPEGKARRQGQKARPEGKGIWY